MDPARIRSKLAFIGAAEAGRLGGGAPPELAPRLSEADLEDIERQHQAKLPEAYRTFLREVGAGGAGPGLGLYPLVRAGALWEWEGDFGGHAQDLTRPFVHTRAKDLTAHEIWDRRPPQTDGPALEVWEEELEALLDAPDWTDGAIVLGEASEASEHLLVVTGPERGHVWLDERRACYGIRPIAGPGGAPRVTFDVWYEAWLDARIAELTTAAHLMPS